MPGIKVANAPCSWGVLEFELAAEPLDYARVLDEMRETGYVGTELGDWGFMPTDPARLRSELERRRLSLLGGFVPISLADKDAHAAGVEHALKVAHLMAAVAPDAFLVLADDNGKHPVRTRKAGRIERSDGLSDGQWRVFSRGAEDVARQVLDQTGLRTVFHHHCAGYVETPEEVDRFLDMTDPELVGLCFDSGHFLFAGGDPSAGIRRFAERIRHVHFKDCSLQVKRESREAEWDYFEALAHGVFCPLGSGEVDFPALLGVLRETGYEGWIVVEQDVLPGMGDPKHWADRNRRYLKSLGI